jgi:hypothetical protein
MQLQSHRAGRHQHLVRCGLGNGGIARADQNRKRTRYTRSSTLDDICWIWSKRASSTSIVASLYRLAVVPFHLVQQRDRNVA